MVRSLDLYRLTRTGRTRRGRRTNEYSQYPRTSSAHKNAELHAHRSRRLSFVENNLKLVKASARIVAPSDGQPSRAKSRARRSIAPRRVINTCIQRHHRAQNRASTHQRSRSRARKARLISRFTRERRQLELVSISLHRSKLPRVVARDAEFSLPCSRALFESFTASSMRVVVTFERAPSPGIVNFYDAFPCTPAKWNWNERLLIILSQHERANPRQSIYPRHPVSLLYPKNRPNSRRHRRPSSRSLALRQPKTALASRVQTRPIGSRTHPAI